MPKAGEWAGGFNFSREDCDCSKSSSYDLYPPLIRLLNFNWASLRAAYCACALKPNAAALTEGGPTGEFLGPLVGGRVQGEPPVRQGDDLPALLDVRAAQLLPRVLQPAGLLDPPQAPRVLEPADGLAPVRFGDDGVEVVPARRLQRAHLVRFLSVRA